LFILEKTTPENFSIYVFYKLGTECLQSETQALLSLRFA